MSASMPSTAPASSASMNGGMARSNTTARPGSSTRQPMILSVSGHIRSPAPAMVAIPPSPARTTAAAAPSPKMAVATIAAGIVAVEADGDRAGFDGDEQPAPARLGRGEARGGGEAVDAAGAAHAEDRHAPDVVAKADRRAVARIEAGRRDAGGRDRRRRRRCPLASGPPARWPGVAASRNSASHASR